MKINEIKTKLLLFCTFLLLTPAIAHSQTTLVTGTPSNSYLSTPITTPSPNLGGVLVNFDSLTPGSTFSSYSSQGLTISSPDGLAVLPFSTQSGPNELFDTSSNGSANIFVGFAAGTNALGVGIADSDPVTIMLQALNATGGDVGSAFSVTIPEIGSNPGNGYFVIEDLSGPIYGLEITQAAGNANYSGLAIDDVQAAPEPATYALLLPALLLIIVWRKRLSELMGSATETSY